MRELTLAEFDLIVGGDEPTTVSPVVIVGSSGMGWGWGWGSWGIGGGYGDGGGVNTQQQQAPPPQPTEGQIDSQACAAASSIRSQAHYSSQEYGYFIITDADGTTRLSPMFTSGEDNRIDFGGGSLSLEELGISDWSQVKGFVHNHPYEVDNPLIPGDINLLNRRPSDADWDLMSQIVGAGGGGNSDFRLYIIGPDGVARQYNPDSPQNQTSTDTSGGNCH